MLVETDQRRQLSLTTQDGKEKFMSCCPSISVDELLSESLLPRVRNRELHGHRALLAQRGELQIGSYSWVDAAINADRRSVRGRYVDMIYVILLIQ